MSERNSTDYYERRERKERTLAAAAADPQIAAIHLEMAERYAMLAGEGRQAAPQRLRLVLGA